MWDVSRGPVSRSAHISMGKVDAGLIRCTVREMHVCGLQKMVVRIIAFGGSVIQGAYGMVDRSSSSRSRAELKSLT